MTGAQFGTFVLALIVVVVVAAIVVWLVNWLYLRSSKERAFVRTGLGGEMPTFSEAEIPSGELDLIVAYVLAQRSHDPPGED